MTAVKTDWRIVKSINPKPGARWDIETREFLAETDPAGAVHWTMTRNWARHSSTASKPAALTRIMLLRERGETVTWQGGAIRLGIARIEPC